MSKYNGTKMERSPYARAIANGMDLVEARQFLPHVKTAVLMEQRRDQWDKIAPLLAFIGTKRFEKSVMSRTESLFLSEERQAQVNSKKGTKNDLARIAEIKLMDSILSDHAKALKYQTEINLLSLGVAWLLYPVTNKIPFDDWKEGILIGGASCLL